MLGGFPDRPAIVAQFVVEGHNTPSQWHTLVKSKRRNSVDPIRLPNDAAARYADGHILRAFEVRKWRTLAKMRV